MRNQILLTLAALAVTTGCSSSASKGLTVSASSSTSVSATNTVASGNTIDAGNGIVVTRIRVVVARAEIEGSPACTNTVAPPPPVPVTPPATPPATMSGGTRAGLSALDDHSGSGSGGGGMSGGSGSGSDDAEDGEDDHGECEVEGGPYLVDLAGADLTGGTKFVVGLDVPAGTYDEVKFKINTISASKAGTDAGLLAMADAHASVLVDGTMDGVPFQFSTPMSMTQSREGAIVVDATTGANVTLDFDASSWFKAADGSKLDPTDPTDQGAILANIRASIRVVSDDDHDGKEDGEHGGNGSGHH